MVRKLAALLLGVCLVVALAAPAAANQLTVKTMSGAYDDALDTAGFESAENGGDSFTVTGKEWIVFRNTSGSDSEVTVNSVADRLGRKNDLTDTVPANDIAMVGPMKREGWEQSNGTILITYPDGVTSIEVAIIRRK